MSHDTSGIWLMTVKDEPTGVLFLLDIEHIHYTAQLLLSRL